MPDKKNISPHSADSKILLVVRHAKSSWEIGTPSDFDRSLNERGKKDAPMMANRLLDKNINIDAFVASPAKRAKKTAELFCEQYHHPADSIHFIPALYHAGVDDFYEAVEQLDDHLNTVAIFSHNPGITYFVNTLSDKLQVDDMPTCSIYAIKIHTKNWSEFRKAKKEFLFFDFPKKDV